MFLVFRGTTTANNNADWVSNLRFGVVPTTNGPVHSGFHQIFSSMLPQISGFVSTYGTKATTYHCIGHSLGGAIATLTANWLKSDKTRSVKLYTFGAPKPGMLLFSSIFTHKLGKQNIFRAYHPTDPVPMIPLFPFVHAPLPGYGHYLHQHENLISTEAHDMRQYVESVAKRSWSDLERKAPPYTIETAIEQWLQSKMPVNASSPKIWEWINAALIYVLKKITSSAVHALQAGFIGALTTADLIAYMLRKGIELQLAARTWVLHLMRKIMQVLGMKVPDKSEDLTYAVIRHALGRILHRITEDAKRVVMKL